LAADSNHPIGAAGAGLGGGAAGAFLGAGFLGGLFLGALTVVFLAADLRAFAALFLAAPRLATVFLALFFAADRPRLATARPVFFLADFAALFLDLALRPPRFAFLVAAICSSCLPHAGSLSHIR